jgi:UDP-N-acetylglucosamine--N-acetylmuramyl-(pentapeptide) pyrophosphoryl-undecaprenol N-acetylglucosamine transferase
MSGSKTKKIMIAGGGTGGHIYPAIAIGRALQKLNPHIELRFVGTAEGLESKIMSRENLALDLIQSGKLNFSGSPQKKIKTLCKIPIGLFQSLVLILKHKPDFILGVGGYASAPFVLMAALLGKKTAIWEPNAHPGMANRLLSKIVDKSYLVFEASKKYLSSKDNQVFGMPLREEIENAKNEERSKISETLTILCFGGSQGSLFLNEKISNFILKHTELHERISLIHQTGSLDFKNMQKKYGATKCVEIHEFIFDMPNQYKRADIQFCRGGASTIAEASAFGVVPLIVPLPAADDHQLRNAEAVVANHAGYLFKQNEFNENEFYLTILRLLEDPKLRRDMSDKLKTLAPARASLKIAQDILRLCDVNPYQNETKADENPVI